MRVIADAVDEEGWRIVALLRFASPTPSSVQNYVFGVTRIGFWPYTLASIVFVIPQTVFYVYLGSVGRSLCSAISLRRSGCSSCWPALDVWRQRLSLSGARPARRCGGRNCVSRCAVTRALVRVVLTSPNGAPKGEPANQGRLLPRQTGEELMKALVATIFAAGMSLTTLSSAQAITITAAPLAEAAKQTSSVVEVQGCPRGTMMGSRGCEAISWNYKRSTPRKRSARSSCLCSPVPPAAVLPSTLPKAFLLGIEFELRVGRSAEI